MKFRLDKVEEGVPFVNIPIGHIAKGVVSNRRVLRALDHGVLFPGFQCDSVRSFEGKYIDLGPLAEQEKPKVVPFRQIPVGHVGKTGSAYWFRANSGGVQLPSGLYLPIHEFEERYEDLGKLAVEDE